MADSMLTVVGDTKTWRLKKQRVLGKGSFGMATLYQDTDTNELLVVKDLNLQCIKRAADVEAVHSEILILKRTSSHPNIVHYLDSSFDGKFSMQILMEYCDGGDLGELLEHAERRQQHLEEQQIVSLMAQVLMGLHHLHHDHRILHRDLKPQNIFLTKSGMAKIGDFGVSTALSQNVEFAKTFCGSPYYLAPEMCEEKRYNGKADLWSCGVMLYEMLTLRKPFDGKNLLTLVSQITKADYPPIPDTLGYSSQVCDLAGSLLQLQPDHRPALKRVLRSSLILSSWRSLPPQCTSNEFYIHAFNRQPCTPGARQAVENSGVTSSSEKSKSEAALLAEMEAWAASDKDALQRSEEALGLRRRELVDTRMLDGTQLKEMRGSAAGGSGSTTQPNLTLTASADDETWNQMYDDDFEDDDDVAFECAPSAVPLVERSFDFSRMR